MSAPRTTRIRCSAKRLEENINDAYRFLVANYERGDVAGFALNSPVVLTGTLAFEFLLASNRQHICQGTYDAEYRKS